MKLLLETWNAGLGAALSLLALATAHAQDASTTTLPVDSPAFVFSPGNWTGDTGRGGSVFRQTWYPGAYFRVTWTTTGTSPTAELLFDLSTYGDKVKNPPELTYCMDGAWTGSVRCAALIPINGLRGTGPHTLTVYVRTSEQAERWGTPDKSGLNVVRVTGLKVDGESTATHATAAKRWALIVGDSITEGSAADFGKGDNLASWSYFVGVGLQDSGYEYGVSACGYSGWVGAGDRTGDVPPYYLVTKSDNGQGGNYDETRSRWDKIDAGHSLLDARNRLSAYGETGQEPSVILINYGTNDALSKKNPSDVQASITQSLAALRAAAPDARICLVVPFGQYAVNEIKAGLAADQAACADKPGVLLIDLGETVAKTLATNGYWSGLHPNMRGHAVFASRILAQLVAALPLPSHP